MLETHREIVWFKSAAKEFQTFPQTAQDKILDALIVAAQGETPGLSKPFKGVGGGVFEIALKYRKDAYRTVYALQIDDDIWVIHAFKKKSKTGIKTPKQDVDLIKARIKFLKEKKQWPKTMILK